MDSKEDTNWDGEDNLKNTSLDDTVFLFVCFVFADVKFCSMKHIVDVRFIAVLSFEKSEPVKEQYVTRRTSWNMGNNDDYFSGNVSFHFFDIQVDTGTVITLLHLLESLIIFIDYLSNITRVLFTVIICMTGIRQN